MGNLDTKKNENVFTLSFDRNDPYHQKVIEILNARGRKKAQYIVNAVMAFESGENTDYGHIREMIELIVREKNVEELNSSSCESKLQKDGSTGQSSNGMSDILQSLDSFRV